MSWFLRTSLLFLFFSSFIVSHDDGTALYAQSNAATEVEQLDFANGLFQRGLYGMAVTEYKNYMASFKEGQFLADAQFGIAESLFFQQSYSEAVASYQEYLNRYPQGDKIAITQLRMGQAFFLALKYDQALAALNQVNREVLSDGLKQTLDYYSGRVYRQKGDNENALHALSLAVLFPEQPIFIARAFLVMGDIYLEQEKFEEAVKNYTRAFGQAQEDGLKSLALYKKGEASFTAGKYDEAAKTFKEVVTQFSDKSIANDALVNLLNAYYNLGQFENVVQEFRVYEARVSEESRVFNIYEVAANTLLQLSEYDLALTVLDKGLSLPLITKEQKAGLQQKKSRMSYSIRTIQGSDWPYSGRTDTSNNPEGPDYVFGSGKLLWPGPIRSSLGRLSKNCY